MKVKFNDKIEHGKNLSRDKELVSCYQVIVNTKDGLKNPVNVKCWMGRSNSASVVCASIWVHNSKTHDYRSGHGKAGGYGYDKESAAIGSAIRSANIILEKSISGVGPSAVREALESIVRKMGYKGSLYIAEC